MSATISSSSSYRTRDIARAVNQTPRSVQLFLRAKFPEHEGWHSFTHEEFQALVKEIIASIPERRARERRAFFQSRKRR